jgi:hypothetical protein
MKTRMLFAISMLALGNGCALMTPEQPSFNGTDQAYMASVERAAHSTNVQVLWVNPPRAKAAVQ